MKITRENYELFLVDYLDGNLVEADKEVLMQFLAQHPNLAEEFSLLNNAIPLVLNQDKTIDKVDFTYLKKEENTWIADDEMIAAMEGDLSEEEQALFERKLILYPQNKANYELFLKTKLTPNKEVFERKESIKKKTGLSFSLYANYFAIAATLLLVGFLGLLYNSNQNADSLASNITTSKRSEPNANEATRLSAPSLEASKQSNTEKLAINEQAIKEVEPSKKGKANHAMSTTKAIPKLSLPKEAVIKENVVQIQSRNMPTQLENNQTWVGAKSTLSRPNIGKLYVEQRALANENVIGSDQAKVEQTPYMNPTDWLKQKMKASLPVASTTLDTLKQGGARVAGTYAMQLVERTTGISYQEKNDAINERRGFAIISKYFAYERNYKTEKY
jgi:hypothetical protein